MAESNTNIGGANVGGNASAGGDFIGRDRYSGGDGSSSSRVEIHTEPHRANEYTSAEILQNLQKAILGNPYNLAEPGLLKSMAELSGLMAGFHAWRSAADVERSNLSRDIKQFQAHSNQRQDTTESRLSQFMVIVWVTLAVVGIEAVALIWLFIRLSA